MFIRIFSMLTVSILAQLGWAQDAILKVNIPNPAPGNYDYFGHSVAVVGNDTLVIGANGDATGAFRGGRALLFKVNGEFLRALTIPNPALDDWFGYAVASVGPDHVVVGAPYRGAIHSGAAFLFHVDGSLVKTFTDPSSSIGGKFGWSVAGLGNNRVIVGAPSDDSSGENSGSAFVFDTNGVLIAEIVNPTPSLMGGDQFGVSVAAVGDDRLLVGADRANFGAGFSGAAHLFDATGQLLTTFTNTVPENNDYFGHAIAALGSDRVIISAYGDNPPGLITGASQIGLVHLFRTSGEHLVTITNPNPATIDNFGTSVASMGNDRVLVGELNIGSSGAAGAGTAFLFNTNGTLLATFTNPTPESGDYFGYTIAAVGSDQVLIGAFHDDTGATSAGAAYLFALPAPPSLTIQPSTQGHVSISWNPTIPGYVLQEREDLRLGDWDASPAGSASPVLRPTSSPTRFFRLFKE